MKDPARMLELADDPAELSALTEIFGRRSSLLGVLEATGRAARIRQWGSLINGSGDTSTNRQSMLSICREFDQVILRDFFHDECRSHMGSPLYATPGKFFVKPPLAGMVIYKDEFVDVHYMQSSPLQAAAAFQAGVETGITINGTDSLVFFTDTPGVEYQVYPVHTGDESDPRLGPPSRGQSASGDHLFLEGGRQGMHLLHGSSPTSIIVCLSSRSRSEVTQHFSLPSGKLVGCTATSVTDSRLQIIATALSYLRGSDNTGALLDMSRHPTTFVRWNALRSLYRVDPAAASERLKEMRENDVNEEIRKLATRSLEQG
ncbi:HEAT repeat domain-containing protein [Stenotrophomonas maltophilia]|uniref:HEAT repeat domain-containing protein n=1 Tax=Stenotrophomonas maltophilia TaxID=40324 RepID=UPI001EF95EA5|nr:HEAT repeat domain-containing protein [Stenotrophomonas maltophilia]